MSFIEKNPYIEKSFDNRNINDGFLKGFGKFLDQKFSSFFSADNLVNVHNPHHSFEPPPINAMDSAHSMNYNMSPNSVFEANHFYNPNNNAFGGKNSGFDMQS